MIPMASTSKYYFKGAYMNYQEIYNRLTKRGQTRTLSSDVLVEGHHIIPECVGGTDDPENISPLTLEEHFMAHKLLTKIYPHDSQLWYAYHRMSNCGKYKNRSYYRYAREKHREIVSKWSKEFMTGKVSAHDTKTGKNVIITTEEFHDSNGRYHGINKGKKYENSPNTGHGTFIDSEGNYTRVPLTDERVLSGEFKGVNHGKDMSKQSQAFIDMMKITPWYKKPNTKESAISWCFKLYDWYFSNYNSEKPKATGIKKFYTTNELTKSKTLNKLFKDFQDGYNPYNPYNDTGLLEYVKVNEIIRY